MIMDITFKMECNELRMKFEYQTQFLLDLGKGLCIEDTTAFYGGEWTEMVADMTLPLSTEEELFTIELAAFRSCLISALGDLCIKWKEYGVDLSPFIRQAEHNEFKYEKE
jgi:hypothetical protein